MIAAVKIDNLVGSRLVQNTVDRKENPPSTISIIENPFFESETCRSGLFCAACRSEGSPGESFRAQVSERWGISQNFMCPYSLEGCEFRGSVLSVEQKTCCGGKVKTITTYECLSGQNHGRVTIDECMNCPIRNRRMVTEKREEMVPLSKSPWSDPDRRLFR
jgi:hypothetical protein